MSMQNSIYGGSPGPSWYVFDKIHIGPANSLLANASHDNIFLGRYVLVKYCENVLDPIVRQTLEELVRAGGLESDIQDITEDKKQYFNNYKKEHTQQSYDRVVFQKIYKNNSISYHPICNLHAIQNVIISPDEENYRKLEWDDTYLN